MTEHNLAIDVSHLQKKFKNVMAVKDISIRVKYGEIVGFLGPNGSGKTTCIRMLCGLLIPDAGYGNCLGYDILTEAKSIRRHIGYVPQYFGLYPLLTVYENIAFIAELHGVIDRKEKIFHFMDKFGLLSYKDKRSGSLSGGWKQRLSLVCALIHDPFLLLLDEPTASLDPISRQYFWNIIHELSNQGMTVLLSSHNMDEVLNCHSVTYVYLGQFLMNLPLSQLTTNFNLHTWEVTGKNLAMLSKQLEEVPGVDLVITYLNTIHVSSKDSDALNRALDRFKKIPGYTWTQVDASLDDIFAALFKKDMDKF